MAEQNMSTPKFSKNKIPSWREKAAAVTPFQIPPSPCMKKLGFGTGKKFISHKEFS